MVLPRFIPTLVGNIRLPARIASVRPVHPHTRGEHARRPRTSYGGQGSSPHSWGTLEQGKNEGFGVRFIPTLVGNIFLPCTRSTLKPVHPHTRGEHRAAFMAWRKYFGSSPHSWGTYELHLIAPIDSRFIPTLVGNIDIP